MIHLKYIYEIYFKKFFFQDIKIRVFLPQLPQHKRQAKKKKPTKNAMVATTSTISRAFSFTCMFKLCRPLFALSTRTHMESPRVNSALRSPARETHIGDTDDGFITLQEWQGWGAVSPLPALVQQIVEDLKALEKNFDAPMSFGGNGGRLQVLYSI